MKKIMKYTIVFIIALVLLSGCSFLKSSDSEAVMTETSNLTGPQEEYKNMVKSFDSVTTQSLSDNSENYFLYTGRITCPHCLIFVPKLYKVGLLSINNDIIIKHLNSENGEDTGLEEFREKNDIQYVPNFSYFEDGELVETMNVSDDTTIEEINQFIDNMR